jgi:hypothetical protein
MEPVYRNIEFCRDPKTLWGKLKEGRWDWLGVHRNGQFVLGSPRRGGVSRTIGELTKRHVSVTEGEHGVAVIAHPSHEHLRSVDWHPDEKTAKADFEARVADLRNREGPLIMRVQRLMQERVVEEQYVWKNPSTYDWRPPPG